MKKLCSLSASLVVFKPDRDILKRTLEALQLAGNEAKARYDIRLELTIVDNGNTVNSTDGLESWIEKEARNMPDWSVRLLHGHGNIGYGHGNNLVIDQSRTDYHLVINPDLFVLPDTLIQAIQYMETHPDVGLLTPAVFGEDNERHYLCKRDPTLFIMFLRSFAPSWLRNKFHGYMSRFEMRECNYNKEIDDVPFPSGCFMFFRNSYLQKLGGFDRSYFLYFEDADIGRRMRKIARVVYVPYVKVVHVWARGTHSSLRLRWLTIKSAMIYYKKWGGLY